MVDERDVARFMALVDKLPSGCWYWMGARSRGKGNKKWYGSFRYNGRTVRAHVFSCDELGARGPVPPGYERSHSCHFSMCVNPDHVVPKPREVNCEERWQRYREAAE